MEPTKPESGLAVLSYLIAAAILFPVGYWIKATYHEPIAAWLRAMMYG